MKILVASSGSEDTEAFVTHLDRAGLPHDAQAQILSATEVAVLPMAELATTAESFQDNMKEVRTHADFLRQQIQSKFPKWDVRWVVLPGSPLDVIMSTVGRWHPDLLIAGSHGRSLVGRVLFGSVSQALAQKAPCSVHVVRDAPELNTGPVRIVVPCDGSEEADRVIEEVARRTWPEETEVHILSVAERLAPTAASVMESTGYGSELAYSEMAALDDRARERISQLAADFAVRLRSAGLSVSVKFSHGQFRREVVAEADRCHADVLFVGDRNHGLLEEVLAGSITSSVLTHAHCAVEIVRTTPVSEVGIP